MSISVTVDVEIDYDDIGTDDVISLVEDKIYQYKRKIERLGEEQSKGYRQQLSDFRDNIASAIEIELPAPATIQDELYQEAFDEIRQKFTLEEVQTFLKTRS